MYNIDPMSRTPVYEQIIEQTEKLIATGILKPRDPLPSVRNLSIELSVNPNTIQKTFGELVNRGLIISVPGRGSFISEDAPQIVNRKSRAKLNDLRILVRELYLAGVTEEELADAVRDTVSEVCIKKAFSYDSTDRKEGQEDRA